MDPTLQHSTKSITIISSTAHLNYQGTRKQLDSMLNSFQSQIEAGLSDRYIKNRMVTTLILLN